MLRRRPRRTAFSWIRQPMVGWLLLTLLYVAAAVLSVLLAIAVSTWWPLMLAASSVFAAGACGLTALDRR